MTNTNKQARESYIKQLTLAATVLSNSIKNLPKDAKDLSTIETAISGINADCHSLLDAWSGTKMYDLYAREQSAKAIK